MGLGTRNIVNGRITCVRKGTVAAEVTVDIGADRTITSTMTMDRLRMMGFKIGDEINLQIMASCVGSGEE